MSRFKTKLLIFLTLMGFCLGYSADDHKRIMDGCAAATTTEEIDRLIGDWALLWKEWNLSEEKRAILSRLKSNLDIRRAQLASAAGSAVISSGGTHGSMATGQKDNILKTEAPLEMNAILFPAGYILTIDQWRLINQLLASLPSTGLDDPVQGKFTAFFLANGTKVVVMSQ